MSEPYEIPTCESCGVEYNLREGSEPSKYCDECAHMKVDALELQLSEAQLERDEARAEVGVLKCSRNMLVDRLGGLVEGRPTDDHNYLQRVDELVERENRTRWIPISERMPEKGKCVVWLLKEPWFDGSNSVEGYYDPWPTGQKFWRITRNPGAPQSLKTVTHWQPLPGPPQRP